ncbi:putative LuxR family transcriptional regulator [Quillaja saponaria]|uniref:LuxR family transcriptional regulator n=1 Tax=Quillaja saponaria TaxID=32244 RepID=A0AAD7Q3K3_QUISA|nr:putative LuxR family transcriptional regulator [Quillaja saponaria]
MASAMEQSPYNSSRRQDEPEFNLREWSLKARISRDNTNSRRFSASYIRSFREDTRSFRSNITISSTASSPGYPLRDEIDPATYSFTTALKALQARGGYCSWECLSPDGLALNSKWNEAEKYICNPLSGEVPMECLSAKTLSGRSFRNLTNRITMSAPLVYSSRQIQTKASTSAQEDVAVQLPFPEKKMEGTTRDVGTQSTPPYLSSSSASPSSTPSIKERSIKRCGDSLNSNANIKSQEEIPAPFNDPFLGVAEQVTKQQIPKPDCANLPCASERNRGDRRNKKRKERVDEKR